MKEQGISNHSFSFCDDCRRNKPFMVMREPAILKVFTSDLQKLGISKHNRLLTMPSNRVLFCHSVKHATEACANLKFTGLKL
jgi:hypothetical protein